MPPSHSCHDKGFLIDSLVLLRFGDRCPWSGEQLRPLTSPQARARPGRRSISAPRPASPRAVRGSRRQLARGLPRALPLREQRPPLNRPSLQVERAPGAYHGHGGKGDRRNCRDQRTKPQGP